MKILMLNYEFPPIGGGAANAHLCLLRQYADNSEMQVDVLTSAPKPGTATEDFSENIRIYRVGVHKKALHFWRKTEVIEWLLKAKSAYRRLLRENNYDLAHAFFGFPTGWLCYRSARELPYIISLRGSDVPGQHARFKFDYKILAPAFRGIWKKADALVACSQGLKARALRFLPSVSIDVIPNGVDLETFRPAKAGRKPDTLRLLTVGRLSVTKRVQMLVEAVEILHRDGCKLRFTVAGGGRIEPQLRATVSERGLGDIIEIAGRVDTKNMPKLYRDNDFFISATMQEGMSNAMLEAMASGLPIITTTCEGAAELIADNGIVTKQASAKSIADAVKALAGDEKTYEAMRTAARKQAEKFTWRNSANQYIEIYRKVIESS